jgi:hypothetical protein
MPRTSQSVIQRLLDEMTTIVRSYHPTTRKTGSSIAELICGTAFFPGGAGLWRGDQTFGDLPDYFPERPIMFVAHNFDSIRAHDVAKVKGGEAKSFFWRTLSAYLECAGIDPREGFFTNALMGLKPGSAVGDMPTAAGYEDECRQFLVRQIEIVRPSMIIALGQKAGKRVRAAAAAVPSVVLLHPSARELKPLATRRKVISTQAKVLSDLRTAIRAADAARTKTEM